MIKLSINHTEISTSCLETLVEGNVNSIFVEFSFSSEWETLGKTVFFNNGTVSVSVFLTDNVCAIPWEVLSCPGDLLVSLRGVGDGGGFVLCTENASLGKVEESLADDDADEPESHTVDAVDELIAEMAELMATGGVAGEDGKSAYELAVDSGFNGTLQQWLASLHGIDGVDGIDGVNGTNGADGYTPVKGVDYWTQADIAEIDSHTDSMLSTHTGNDTVHVTSSEKQTWNSKQSKITANGLLRGDGDGGITAATVGTDDISALAVTNAKISNGAVSTGKIANRAVTTDKLAVGINVSAFTNDANYLTLETLPIYDGSVI